MRASDPGPSGAATGRPGTGSHRPVAAIVGSAFQRFDPVHANMEPMRVSTPWGAQELFRTEGEGGRPAYLIFRHGLPHRLLPNQIEYRAQAWALRELECGALLLNSSVGVLDPELPLYTPMLATDLLMPDNRLPDGSTCTMFDRVRDGQGHLLVEAGLFSRELNGQVHGLAPDAIRDPARELVFAYAGGPRGKTPAENRMWRRLGGQVNSMTLAPEVVLANELGIPCAGLVVGHKYSVPEVGNPGPDTVRGTLKRARRATERILLAFLDRGRAVPFGNSLFRF